MHGWYDLTGQKFGKLTAIRRLGSDQAGVSKWECKCDCGNITTVRTNMLMRGTTKSCGCLRKEATKKYWQDRIVDISGQRFGKLIAIKQVPCPPHRKNITRAFWECQCDCGNVHVADGVELRNGSCKSCGCNRKRPEGEAAFNSLWYMYRTSFDRRKRRNKDIPFNLDKETFKRLTKSDCFYCGKEPSSVHKAANGNYTYNGIDRMDNDRGYEPDNVVPCCAECNFYKANHTFQDFTGWIKRISKYWS